MTLAGNRTFANDPVAMQTLELGSDGFASARPSVDFCSSQHEALH